MDFFLYLNYLDILLVKIRLYYRYLVVKISLLSCCLKKNIRGYWFFIGYIIIIIVIGVMVIYYFMLFLF